MQFDRQFITSALSEQALVYDVFPDNALLSIDSRTLKKGDIFIALKGEQCDGHDFIQEVVAKGAVGLIIQEDRRDVLASIPVTTLQKMLVLVVENTIKALVSLARLWRSSIAAPVIAITGSIGKTSTKESIAHILREHGVCHIASEGNQNTLIGVSLNLLRMRQEHAAGIFEVGISSRGEMVEIVDMLRPTNAVVTCIGHQHMDGLGSLHDIAQEKRAVFKFFTERNIGVVNGDQLALSAVAYPHPIIKFGSKTTNQIQARKIRARGDEIHFVLKIYKKKYPLVLKNAHEGAIFNILAATAVAYLLEVPDEAIIRALQKPVYVAGRFESCTLKKHQGMMIDDCYNANPESVKAALIALHHVHTSAQKVVVLGDMLGLGQTTAFWHRQIGRFLRKISSLDRLVLVGENVAWVKKTAPVGLSVEIVSSWQESVPVLERLLEKESLILVKGSSDIGLANVVSTFVDRKGCENSAV